MIACGVPVQRCTAEELPSLCNRVSLVVLLLVIRAMLAMFRRLTLIAARGPQTTAKDGQQRSVEDADSVAGQGNTGADGYSHASNASSILVTRSKIESPDQEPNPYHGCSDSCGCSRPPCQSQSFRLNSQ